MIQDKLNLLMDFFEISNIKLAKALSVDPSLISRWRTGDRVPSTSSNHFHALGRYFESLARTERSKIKLLETMHLDLSENKYIDKNLHQIIEEWLESPSTHTSNLVEQLLQRIITGPVVSNDPELIKRQIKALEGLLSGKRAKNEVLKGLEGKRSGVLLFLSEVCKQTSPITLLLYSDEKMDWLTEDPEFYNAWSLLMFNILTSGHRIKIIHTIQRDLDEMIFAIKRWMPLYMTGAIEPYFFPKANNGLFKRTLFIAPGTVALTSTSLPEFVDSADQFIYTDKSRIESLTDEFNAFLSMCKPLMKIFTPKDFDAFVDLQKEYYGEHHDMITLSSTLHSALPDEHQKLIRKHLLRDKYTEIISYSEEMSMDPENLKHIDHLLQLLKTYDNYQICLYKNNTPTSLALAYKKSTGVILVKKDDPQIVFAFNHPHMTDAFESYMHEIIHQIPKHMKNKKDVIRRLKALSDQIQKNQDQNF